jgi:hypothetical protein
MHLQFLKIQEFRGNADNEAYQAALISRHLQRQCLQVLLRSRTLLQSSMPSQKNITTHVQ